MHDVRAAFLSAGAALSDLLSSAPLTGAWSSPSALDGMTVGGVAGHLVRALETVETYLDDPEPPVGDAFLTPVTYFVLALEGAGPDVHEGIRSRGEDAGSVGPAALAEEHAARLARLTARLAAEPASRRVRVLRGQASMMLDDYLPTRLVEIVVHADDLAASVGAAAPAFDDTVTSSVVSTLVGIARARHGDVAVVRALARRERDDVSALRVL